MRNTVVNLLLLQVSMFFGACVAQAQQFDINWHSIACGGGLWSEDIAQTWELSSTIGDPIAASSATPLSGGAWSLTGGFLSLPVPYPCPTDLDGNGVVDLADLTRLLSHFGVGGTAQEGDIDLDGDIDLIDLTLLLSNIGLTCP